ncbi:hypothetical protein [Halosimplex sp. TS25]
MTVHAPYGFPADDGSETDDTDESEDEGGEFDDAESGRSGGPT